MWIYVFLIPSQKPHGQNYLVLPIKGITLYIPAMHKVIFFRSPNIDHTISTKYIIPILHVPWYRPRRVINILAAGKNGMNLMDKVKWAKKMYNTKFLHDGDGSKTGRASIFDILFYSIGTAETTDLSAGIIWQWRGEKLFWEKWRAHFASILEMMIMWRIK